MAQWKDLETPRWSNETHPGVYDLVSCLSFSTAIHFHIVMHNGRLTKGWGGSSVAQRLPGKHKALSFILSTKNKKKKRDYQSVRKTNVFKKSKGAGTGSKNSEPLPKNTMLYHFLWKPSAVNHNLIKISNKFKRKRMTTGKSYIHFTRFFQTCPGYLK